jgi:hypothetical protein
MPSSTKAFMYVLSALFLFLILVLFIKFGMGLGLTALVIRPLVLEYICQDLPGNSGADIQAFWGSKKLSLQLRGFDFLVLADCFYRKGDFPFLLASIADALACNENLSVICIHHHRK